MLIDLGGAAVRLTATDTFLLCGSRRIRWRASRLAAPAHHAAVCILPLLLEQACLGEPISYEPGMGAYDPLYAPPEKYLIPEQCAAALRKVTERTPVAMEVVASDDSTSAVSRRQRSDIKTWTTMCSDLRVSFRFGAGCRVPCPCTRSPRPTAAISQMLWKSNAPELFDTYSAGLMLMRLAMPPLRTERAYKGFMEDVEACGSIREWCVLRLAARERGAWFCFQRFRAPLSAWDARADRLRCARSAQEGTLRGRNRERRSLGW